MEETTWKTVLNSTPSTVTVRCLGASRPYRVLGANRPAGCWGPALFLLLPGQGAPGISNEVLQVYTLSGLPGKVSGARRQLVTWVMTPRAAREGLPERTGLGMRGQEPPFGS